MQGIMDPSFTMLSLHYFKKIPSQSFLTINICFLPKQLQIYLIYLILFIISMIILIINSNSQKKILPIYSKKFKKKASYSIINYFKNNRIIFTFQEFLKKFVFILFFIIPFYLFLLYIEIIL